MRPKFHASLMNESQVTQEAVRRRWKHGFFLEGDGKQVWAKKRYFWEVPTKRLRVVK